MTAAKVRLAMAAMGQKETGQKETKVTDLCSELAIIPANARKNDCRDPA